MKYLVYLLMRKGEEGENDLITADVRYLEFAFPWEKEEEIIKSFREKPSPRFFTTHLPLRLLRKQVMKDKVKIIVVIRNPKDAAVSNYHHAQMDMTQGPFRGTWDDFFQQRIKKQNLYGDFFDITTEWWKVRHLDNVLVVTYEEMQANLARVVRKVAGFTGYELSDELLQKIVQKSSFREMKNNRKVNNQKLADIGAFDFTKSKFIRKGEIGDWVNYFSEEQNSYIDKQCEERCSPVGLIFQYSAATKIHVQCL